MPHNPSQPISAYLAAAPHARALGRLDLGFGRAATIWRNRDAHIRYDAPQGHVLSFYLRGGGGTRRVDPGVGRQPMRGWQGAFCLMPQGQSSEWDITDSFDFIHLYLPDEELRRAFAETFDRDARQLQLADLPYASAPRLSAPFLALAGAIRDGDPLGGETAMQALTAEILAAAGPYRLPVGHRLAGGLSPQKLRLIADYTEAHLDGPIRLRDLAALVAELTGAEVEMVPDPRKEAAENELIVHNDNFLALGLDPITLSEGLLMEINETAGRYADRADLLITTTVVDKDQYKFPVIDGRPFLTGIGKDKAIAKIIEELKS
mgnify:CR=1 FL=1